MPVVEQVLQRTAIVRVVRGPYRWRAECQLTGQTAKYPAGLDGTVLHRMVSRDFPNKGIIYIVPVLNER